MREWNLVWKGDHIEGIERWLTWWVLRKTCSVLRGMCLEVNLLRTQIQCIKHKLRVSAEDLPEEKRGNVYRKVSFTFFKTESSRSLGGQVTKYTGHTCGSVGQIPHLLFRF